MNGPRASAGGRCRQHLRRHALVAALLALLLASSVAGSMPSAQAVSPHAPALSTPVVAGMPTVAALSGSDWRAGSIISDSDFFDALAMTEADIVTFLNAKGAACVDGAMPCLRSYVTATPATIAETGLCDAMPATVASTAAQIIARVATACRVSPKTILAMIQKESAIVTTTNPTTTMYQTAAGYGCPDFQPCDTAYYGFFNQVYRMSRQFRMYTLNPTRYSIQAGRENAILYHPNTSCGSAPVFVQNQATANLYIYTPFQPNAAALANLGGSGDACSAYGNRNFWVLYTTWWGGALPQIAPRGAVTATATAAGELTVSGWAIDESDLNAAVTVTMMINGKPVAAKTANAPYPALAFYGVPGDHGFTFAAKAPLDGANEVCVIAGNVGGGVDARIGCQTVTVTYPKIDPVGTMTATAAATGVISVTGWAADTSASSEAITVRVTDNGTQVSSVVANRSTPVGTVAGNHGYTASFTPKENGTHSVCAIGVNIYGGTDRSLGCANVTVLLPGSPQGALRSISQDNAGQVSVSGWSFDPSDYAAAVTVMVTWNGAVVGFTKADRPFADLAYYGIPGNHGFTSSFLPSDGGTGSLCAFAFNVGPGGNQLIGCASATVFTPGSPIGAQDSVTRAASGRLIVSGWAWDLDVPLSAVTTMVTVDGVATSFGLANTPYPALAWYGIPGNHGYRHEIAVTSGSHTICTFAFNQGRGANQLLGCARV